MGQAISKTVSVAEGIKRRNPRLHQDTAISSVSITDVWEPLEEGLVPVEQTRQVSMITITLSFQELNKMSSGSSNNNNLDKHVALTMLFLKIHMVVEICMAEDVVEGEDGIGAEVEVDMDMETIMETIVVTTMEAIREITTGTTRETTRKMVVRAMMVVTQIGAGAGAGAGIGVIVTLDMKEEEVEGAEAMAMVVEGWPITQGVAMAMAAKLKKRMVFSPFASAKFLPRPVG
ncbi:RNA-binding protein [Salix suchowensis]|nr:RNA-binding protein [Salix suchowensis]